MPKKVHFILLFYNPLRYRAFKVTTILLNLRKIASVFKRNLFYINKMVELFTINGVTNVFTKTSGACVIKLIMCVSNERSYGPNKCVYFIKLQLC